MSPKSESITQYSNLGAAALLACAGLGASTDIAHAALTADDARRPSNSFFPDSEKLVAQLADDIGVETRKPNHAVGWKVAQIITGPPSKGSDTTSNPGGSQQGKMITNRTLSQVLLGANEQINCSNCFSAFGSVGSYSAGAHGRYNINGQLSIRGGIAFSQYHGRGYKVDSAPILAAALRYDLADWGWSRPFIDVGVTATPSQNSRYTRSYLNFGIPTVGVGKASGYGFGAFVKGGWVFRLTGRDEAAVYGELWRSWQHTAAYTENPVPPQGAFPATNDRTSIAKVGVQWTRLWGSSIETHANVGVARTFNTSTGIVPALVNLGSPTLPVRERTYLEYGLRVGYRFTSKLVLDVFANGAAGPGGNIAQVHVGTALRYSY